MVEVEGLGGSWGFRRFLILEKSFQLCGIVNIFPVEFLAAVTVEENRRIVIKIIGLSGFTTTTAANPRSLGTKTLQKKPALKTDGISTYKPGEATQHLESHVLWLLQRFQHHPATLASWEALSDAGGPWPGGLYHRLPHQQTAIHETAGQPVGCAGEQSPFLFTLYTSDFRFNSSTCHLHTPTTTRWSTELWWRVL